MEIPNKIRLYVGKTTNINDKIILKIQNEFEKLFSNAESYSDNGYGNFHAFVVQLDCTKFVYSPCQIYYDILKGKRENGKVVLTLI